MRHMYSIASWSPSQSDPLIVSYMCQSQLSSDMLPSDAPMPPCAATVCERVGNTFDSTATDSPASANFTTRSKFWSFRIMAVLLIVSDWTTGASAIDKTLALISFFLFLGLCELIDLFHAYRVSYLREGQATSDLGCSTPGCRSCGKQEAHAVSRLWP